MTDADTAVLEARLQVLESRRGVGRGPWALTLVLGGVLLGGLGVYAHRLRADLRTVEAADIRATSVMVRRIAQAQAAEAARDRAWKARLAEFGEEVQAAKREATVCAERARKVGVVNIRELFAKDGQVATKQAALKGQVEEMHVRLQQRLRTLRAAKERLEAGRWPKDSEIYREKLRTLAERYEALKAEMDWETLQFDRAVKGLAEAHYQRILDAVAAYAVDEGYDLVIKSDGIASPKADASLAARVNRRQVLHHTRGLERAVDITDAILRRLDAKD